MEKEQNKIVAFLLKHKIVIGLIIIFVVYWFYTNNKLNNQKEAFENTISNIEMQYEHKLDSTKVAGMNQMAKVFSWAVRSELIRNNVENVVQLMMNLVKERAINSISLINASDNKVILSTNKKEEGEQFSSLNVASISNLFVQEDSLRVRIYSPILGIDSKLGVLYFDIAR